VTAEGNGNRKENTEHTVPLAVTTDRKIHPEPGADVPLLRSDADGTTHFTSHIKLQANH
jgi:hypothetical protein